MNAIESIAEQKLLLRALVDNARSDDAGLTDNELVTFLMTLQGFTHGEIARVLEKTGSSYKSKERMGISNIHALKKNAFRKLLDVSGLSDRPVQLRPQKEDTMPRGVYDRSKSKKPARRTNGAVPPPESDLAWEWGQPYEIDASTIMLDLFCDEADRCLDHAPAGKAVVFPFETDDNAEAAAAALARRNPPRVIVLRWLK